MSVTACFERIAAAVSSLPHEVFTIREVRALVPEQNKNSLTAFFTIKSRAGWLERVGRGTYRRGGVRIKTFLPHSLVAEAVWAALHTDPERKPRLLREVTEDAESFVGREGVSLYSNVSHVLGYWAKTGALVRTGTRGEYRFCLNDGVKERPVMRGGC
jgi:hypothetical protein